MTKVKKIQRRTLQIKAKASNAKDQTVEFSFSSEAPAEQYFGKEILSHEPGAMDLSRLKAKAPLLFNHDRDNHIGVVEEAWVGDDKRGYCRVRFSNSPLGKEKFQDVMDGILVNVSFGYEIRKMELKSSDDKEGATYLVTDFCPFEISTVSIPADFSVGVGRALDEELEVEDEQEDEDENEEDETREDEDADTKDGEENEQEKAKYLKKEMKIEVSNFNERDLKMTPEEIKAQKEEAAKGAQVRVMNIIDLGTKHGEPEMARQFIENGKSVEEFARALVEKLGGKQAAINDKPVELTEKQKKEYSISRAINAVVNKNWKGAEFELEVSKELGKRAGKDTDGFFMPMNIASRAAYSGAAAATGGNLVQTSVLGSEFIDVLRARAVLMKAGAKVLSGLTGNVAIPRKNGRSAAYWIAENGTITESEATFDQVPLSLKTVAALSSVSKQLIAQASVSVDALISDDLSKELALAIDGAGIYGTGLSGQPKGILNQSGIGSVALGTNGAALTFDALVDLESAVAVANADADGMCYITNPKQIGVMKKIKDSQNRYLWSAVGLGSPAGFPAPDASSAGVVNGYAIHRTNQVPGNLTKGTGTNLSAVIFGDFSQLVIAQWMSGIEILVNPYGSSFAKGGIDIRAMAMVDVAVRHPESFAAITDAL